MIQVATVAKGPITRLALDRSCYLISVNRVLGISIIPRVQYLRTLFRSAVLAAASQLFQQVIIALSRRQFVENERATVRVCAMATNGPLWGHLAEALSDSKLI